MERVPDTYTFIIVFKDENDYIKSLDRMNDFGVPEKFSSQIYADIKENKCDKKEIVKLIEEAVEDENWWKFYDIYSSEIYSKKNQGRLKKQNKNDFLKEIKDIPRCCYFSAIEYSNDDFCYEILKQFIMPNFDFVYRVIANN